MYVGDFAVDSIVHIWFSTNKADGTKESFSAALEDADFAIYKGSSLTQHTVIASVVTFVEDMDGMTGVHRLDIDTSVDSHSGFFAAGNDYSVVLYPDTETLDGKAVSSVIGHFSIENRFSSSSVVQKAAKVIVNKAVQNKSTGAIDYYDNDEATVILTQTPTDSATEITRTPS